MDERRDCLAWRAPEKPVAARLRESPKTAKLKQSEPCSEKVDNNEFTAARRNGVREILR